MANNNCRIVFYFLAVGVPYDGSRELLLVHQLSVCFVSLLLGWAGPGCKPASTCGGGTLYLPALLLLLSTQEEAQKDPAFAQDSLFTATDD